jgi:hypothetical protein
MFYLCFALKSFCKQKPLKIGLRIKSRAVKIYCLALTDLNQLYLITQKKGGECERYELGSCKDFPELGSI